MGRFRAQNVPRAKATPTNIFSINNFKGLNVAISPTEIDDVESPELLNIVIGLDGGLRRRKGYKRIYQTSLGIGIIRGLHVYEKLDNTQEILTAHAGKLYRVILGSQPIEIATPDGIANHKVKFFNFNNKAYILDGTHYYVYDGTTVKRVSDEAYIPTVTISRAPNGTATNYNEDINLLTPGFIESFSGTASDTLYRLTYAGLDATAVVVTANNITRTEGIHFTVDRTAGTIDFTKGSTPLGSPGLGTNNVKIKAFKTLTGNIELITKCYINALYGGRNDTRVFLAHPDSNVLNYSGVYNPTYFPENNFIRVGSDSEGIKGFTIQYDTLIIHKEHSKWNLSYAVDELGAYFPTRPINDSIGCISEDSIQLLNNDPVTLTQQGVFILQGGQVRDERNVTSISEKVDPLISAEQNREEAISVDFKNKYYLVINNKAYIFNYYTGIWYLWDNIKASCFMILNNELYFGSNEEGLIYKFGAETEVLYNDDGNPINTIWKSKIMPLGTYSHEKLIEKVALAVEPGLPSSADVAYKSDLSERIEAGNVRRKLISYYPLKYNDFSYQARIYPHILSLKLRAKKVVFFQLIIENNRLDESMDILNIDIRYQITGDKK